MDDRATISIVVGVNDERGTFTGFICHLHTYNPDLELSTLSEDTQFYYNQKDKFFLIGKLKVPFIISKTWGGSWSCDEILITKANLARILNFLRMIETWCMEEAECQLYDKWDSKQNFTGQDFINESQEPCHK